MTLVNARAAFEKAVTDAVVAADSSVLMIYDNVRFTTPGKTKKYVSMRVAFNQSTLQTYFFWISAELRPELCRYQMKANSDDAGDFALGMMIEKALDADGKRLFQDGEKAALRNAVEAAVLQEIQLAMLASGTENKVEDAKAALKSK